MFAFVLVLVFIASVKAATNITDAELASTKDLFDFTVKQLTLDLKIYEDNVNLMQTRYAERLKVIESNTEFLDRMLLQTNENFDRLAVFNAFYKSCVDKYRFKIASIASVQTEIKACMSAAQYPSLLTYSTDQLKLARNEVNSYMLTDYNACVKANTVYANLTSCVHRNIAYRSNMVKSYLTKIDQDMDHKLCSSATYAKHAQQCVTDVMSKTMKTVGANSQLVDNCIEGRDEPLPCVPYANVSNVRLAISH